MCQQSFPVKRERGTTDERMNRALFYLWLTLLKRRSLHLCRGLRRPTTLIGFAAVLWLGGVLFHFRGHEVFGQLVRRESLIGGALVMLGGSVFKGFLQRGLAFEPPDIEFLFTSPFAQRQIVFYRLLPSYLFALVQGLVFFGLFAPHLKHPLLATLCFILFQIVCFHVATAAAIFAGTISERSHHRVRWMLLSVYFVLTAVYLRGVWDIRIIPSSAASPFVQLLFYPAVTLSDIGTAPSVREWALRLMGASYFSARPLWLPALYLCGFGLSAAVSLWLLLKLKANVFEISLATTTRVAEKRLRVQQGHRVAVVEGSPLCSARLPKFALFRGVGAIFWKNLVVARRSKRDLMLACAFTLIYTGLLAAIRWGLRDAMAEGGELSAGEMAEFDAGVMMLLASLAFLLQWAFPFDFRRDGPHLVGFRTLPVSPFALVLAEIAVPTAFCLAFQGLGIGLLMIYGRFDWPVLVLMLFGYPAIALALNGVWNLHYLLSATKRAGGRVQSDSAVGTLMVVALSFLIFFPAGWAAAQIGDHFVELGGKPGIAPAAGGFLVVQYSVDFLLVLILARMFHRFEVSRDP
jgi:hypothetical protein